MSTTGVVLIGDYDDFCVAETLRVLVSPFSGTAGIACADPACGDDREDVFLTFDNVYRPPLGHCFD